MEANFRMAGTLVLLWLVGLYMRLPILLAPPLAPMIGIELDLNETQIGALTTVPVLMLALGALPGSLAIARLGPRLTVVLALVLLAAASAGRGLAPPGWLLFAATALLGLAIAVMQPALPVLVKRWCPASVALGSAVYMNGLLMGEFLGAGLTLPLVMPLLDGDWRATLLAWSVPAVAVALAVQLHNGSATERAAAGEGITWKPRWRDPLVWQLGILLGAASAGFFGTNAYLGSVLEERGQGGRLASVLFAFNVTQVAGSFLMIALARRLEGRHWPVIAAAAALPAGLLGVIFGADHLFLVAVVVLGLSTCVQLILMVSLVPQIAAEPDTGPLAAGMFAVGYLLGFAVPLLGGVLADAAGSARLALLPLGVLALVSLAVASTVRFGHGSRRSSTSTGERDVR
ncbi:MAG: MFS transporter [Gammaproteobacteria bacterium]|nr:MFS transporter [Gammaproteobacteria bacterium]